MNPDWVDQRIENRADPKGALIKVWTLEAASDEPRWSHCVAAVVLGAEDGG